MLGMHRIVAAIKVPGGACFPYDMLRYDECFPNSSSDAAKIERLPQVEGTVIEVAAYGDGMNHWEKARWRSFGCDCTPLSD